MKNKIITILVLLFLYQIAYSQTFKVESVYDGDTIKLSNGEVIRLIGVDTPETKHPSKPIQYFGEEASKFLKNQLEGNSVRLEYDKKNISSNHKGKYGRTLAYVWYKPEGSTVMVNVNKELISKGYGYCYTKYGEFKYVDEFRKTQQMAIENKRGMWKLLVHDINSRHFFKLYADLDENDRGKVLIYMKRLLGD